MIEGGEFPRSATHPAPSRLEVAKSTARRNTVPVGMALIVVAAWLPTADLAPIGIGVAVVAGALVARAK